MPVRLSPKKYEDIENNYKFVDEFFAKDQFLSRKVW